MSSLLHSDERDTLIIMDCLGLGWEQKSEKDFARSGRAVVQESVPPHAPPRPNSPRAAVPKLFCGARRLVSEYSTQVEEPIGKGGECSESTDGRLSTFARSVRTQRMVAITAGHAGRSRRTATAVYLAECGGAKAPITSSAKSCLWATSPPPLARILSAIACGVASCAGGENYLKIPIG